ncbi:MAG: hypothetical protein KY434_09550 [Actinobacteria bacterium]|nr:hypothetical protein [Actinomycetota bacterium]
MLTDLLPRLARHAPVPVCLARGLAATGVTTRLRADPDVRLVASPRQATVLVIAGAVPRAARDAVLRVHDQVPAPRGVAVVGDQSLVEWLDLGDVPVLPADDPVPGLRRLHEQLLAGAGGSPSRGPADNPVEWSGVGPHGQGGEGMMGGKPYGRPMAMPPQEGRDGLALDRLPLVFGPFLPALPAAVQLEVGLQGDVLEEVRVVPLDLDAGVVGSSRPLSSAAGRYLAAVAELCAVAGLDALACRAARVALDPAPEALADLRRRLRRRGGLRQATDGVGRLPDGRDATDRWHRWLDLAAAAAAGEHAGHDRVDPRELGPALVGLELGHALVTLSSLRLELEDAVAAPLGAGA